jgi:HTH-type transcriptional regulator / antitoxin HigA
MTKGSGKKTKEMASPTTKTRSARTLNGYLKLVRLFPLRPIRSEAELDRATTVIHSLLDRDQLSAAEQDYLDVLGDLVERYETQHHPIGDVSDADVLEHLLEAKGVTQAAVARATGIAESRLSEVLRGKRQLTRAQITKLAAYFHVGPAVFLPSKDAAIRRHHRGRG